MLTRILSCRLATELEVGEQKPEDQRCEDQMSEEGQLGRTEEQQMSEEQMSGMGQLEQFEEATADKLLIPAAALSVDACEWDFLFLICSFMMLCPVCFFAGSGLCRCFVLCARFVPLKIHCTAQHVLHTPQQKASAYHMSASS